VKLEKNTSDTCALLSKAYGGEAMKKSSGINSLKTILRTWKMMKEVVIQDFTELMKILKSVGSVAFR
jgi:hypothetical protein